MDLLETRRHTHRLTIMYKIANNLIDIDKHEYLQAPHSRNTRNSSIHNFMTYHTNTDSYKHSFFSRTIRRWNRLPQNVLEQKTVEKFTNKVHAHLTNTTMTVTNITTLTLSFILNLFPPVTNPYACYALTSALRINNWDWEIEIAIFFSPSAIILKNFTHLTLNSSLHYSGFSIYKCHMIKCCFLIGCNLPSTVSYDHCDWLRCTKANVDLEAPFRAEVGERCLWNVLCIPWGICQISGHQMSLAGQRLVEPTKIFTIAINLFLSKKLCGIVSLCTCEVI